MKEKPASKKVTAKPDTVRVNFDLDRNEYIKLKVHAAVTDQSISDVLRTCVAKLELVFDEK